jgi:uncharacterized membrane protein YjjP (DUF1212 family)
MAHNPEEKLSAAHPSDEEPSDADHLELLVALGQALHASGEPSHRLERTLEGIARRLDVPLQVFALPTGLMLCVGETKAPLTVIRRVEPGGVHLERLVLLERIGERVAKGLLEPREAKRRIDHAMGAKPRWRKPATVLAYVLSAGSFAVFFGGGKIEVATAVLVGLVVGLMAVVLRDLLRAPRLFELTAAAAAAVIASVVQLYVDSFIDWIPLASGLIILLPGLTLVDSVDELAHGHLTSGASRLAGVAVVLLAMSFGAVLGLAITPDAEARTPETAHTDLTWWCAPALVTVAVGSTIRFRARPIDFWPALVGSVTALLGMHVADRWLDTMARPFVAAFLLGIAANGFARLWHRPAELVAVPGLALLVPGAFGVRTIAALLSEDTALGVDTAFHMFIVAMALVTGLLFSNAFFREPSR